MAIPDYQSLMLPVLKISANGEIRIGQAVDELANKLDLTQDERTELLPSGKQTLFSNRVHWAKTYLNKAGLVEITRRGHFKITPRGREALQSNPPQIDNQFLSQYEEFNQFREKTNSTETGNSGESVSFDDQKQTPDEIMREAYRKIEASLAQDLLDRIRKAPPDFFERLIVTLLLSMGYGGTEAEAGKALGQSGDNGVDGVIDQDALGLDRVYIQAKRYAEGNSVGAGAIRDFFGSLDRHKATKGLFVTTSTFSLSAKETAEFLSKRIVLIDNLQLAKLMIRYNVGCRIEDTIHIRKVDEEFFDV
ncbi:restriction endonuclease [Methylotuvimicrobium buryatense]|uniref:Restriction endonuclease n=2 Tax=Methylotuvimicrobium buryatense TaxID=95641 RepID=A0A4P9USZ1_METBY|nr:restriction endonuclease [Methylotuvimicrobium buryatense]QCW83663.1 restriction endonuclease [Methylotuvimicrobium buryatense]